MGRPTKEGLDYFPLDTDFFENENVIVLIDKFKSDGVSLFIYILCKCYRKKGYYLIYDDKFKHIAARNLKIGANKIALIIAFLADCSMLKIIKSTTSDGDTAITSDGIQMQFQQTMKRLNRDVKVDRRLWVLDEENTESFIKFTQNGVNRTETDINCTETGVNRKKSAQKKGKEKKRKENKVCADAHSAHTSIQSDNHLFGKHKLVEMSDKEYDELMKLYPSDHEWMINNLDHYLFNHPDKHYRSHFGTMVKWIEEDKRRNIMKVGGEEMSDQRKREYEKLIADEEKWLSEIAEDLDE